MTQICGFGGYRCDIGVWGSSIHGDSVWSHVVSVYKASRTTLAPVTGLWVQTSPARYSPFFFFLNNIPMEFWGHTWI
jgi:hypothetical protein